ncbi:unnamed protein product, partial [Musa acuminata subsp. malaccensis]
MPRTGLPHVLQVSQELRRGCCLLRWLLHDSDDRVRLYFPGGVRSLHFAHRRRRRRRRRFVALGQVERGLPGQQAAVASPAPPTTRGVRHGCCRREVVVLLACLFFGGWESFKAW